jgi:caffeoyl-CoA O-methyltransferase
MFHTITKQILKQMRRLEAIDSMDRVDGTQHLSRLRQVPPETGRFLAVLAAGAPSGKIIEVGTSAGYSSLYLALACKELNRKLLTFEILEEKARLARETFKLAKIENVVELIVGDARSYLKDMTEIAFCFLDAEKETYQDCYNLIIPRMVQGALLVADNAISHAKELQPFIDTANTDDRVDAVIVPIGKGELVCRRC